MKDSVQSTAHYTADEAAHLLKVSRETLYAYVSRGLIRSVRSDKKKRTKHYLREDIDSLINRKSLRNNPEEITRQAMHFGMPIMESSITLIQNNGLYYRGQSAFDLIETHSFETVCQWMWLEEMHMNHSLFTSKWKQWPTPTKTLLKRISGYPPLVQFQTLLPLLQELEIKRFDHRAKAVAGQAAPLIQLLAKLLTPESNHSGDIAPVIAQSTGIPSSLINAILILCADHEFNCASFTARSTCSTNTHLHASINAGLSAIRGDKQGGSILKCESLLNDILNSTNAEKAILKRLQQGQPIPGFGHKLYPQGDPRARYILDTLYHLLPRKKIILRTKRAESAVYEYLGDHANVDLSLAVLCSAYDLPIDFGLSLFCLSRLAGITAHTIEQYALDQLIRPRTQYRGKLP